MGATNKERAMAALVGAAILLVMAGVLLLAHRQAMRQVQAETELKQTVAELIRQSATDRLWKHAIDHSDTAQALIDHEGKIISVSLGFMIRRQQTEDELLGRSLAEALHLPSLRDPTGRYESPAGGLSQLIELARQYERVEVPVSEGVLLESARGGPDVPVGLILNAIPPMITPGAEYPAMIRTVTPLYGSTVVAVRLINADSVVGKH